MQGNEDPFSVLRILESPYSFESCIEMTDVRFKPVRSCRNARICKVSEAITAGIYYRLKWDNKGWRLNYEEVKNSKIDVKL